MSKAFTNEEAPDDPIVVPPRAPLPPGVPNWVTPRGLVVLRAELAALEEERSRLLAEGDDGDRRRLARIDAQLGELVPRIASAEVVDPRAQPPGEVRFGASVVLAVTDGPSEGEERRFRIVGVDEANPAEGRVAFLAPIARAVLGRRVGDVAVVELPRGEEEIEILEIAYDAE